MAVVQYTYTYKRYTERHKTNNTQNNTKILEECGPCPVFAVFTLAFALQLKKKSTEKPQLQYFELLRRHPKNMQIFTFEEREKKYINTLFLNILLCPNFRNRKMRIVQLLPDIRHMQFLIMFCSAGLLYARSAA